MALASSYGKQLREISYYSLYILVLGLCMVSTLEIAIISPLSN